MLFELEIQIWPKLIVYKIAMQCANVKFTSAAYDTCGVVKKRKVVPMKVISVNVTRFLVNSEFNRHSIEIRLCVQFFAKPLPEHCHSLPLFMD